MRLDVVGFVDVGTYTRDEFGEHCSIGVGFYDSQDMSWYPELSQDFAKVSASFFGRF